MPFVMSRNGPVQHRPQLVRKICHWSLFCTR